MAKNEEVFKLKTESDTSGLKDAQNSLGDLADEAEKLVDEVVKSGNVAEDAEGKFTNFASNALAAFTGFLGAQVFTKITDEMAGFVTETMEWNSAFTRLNATTDLTDAQFGELKDSAMDVFATGFGENMTEVTDNLSNAQRVTGLWGDELEKFTEGAMTIDELFGAGFNETMRGANQTMLNFGTGSQESLDLIAYTFQRVGDPAGDLLDTIQEYGSTFAANGYSAEQMFQALIQGNEGGIYAFDKSADAIREFGIRTREGTDAVQGAYEELFATGEEFVFMQQDGTKLVIDSWDELSGAMADGSVDMALVGDRVSEALQGIEDPILRNKIALEVIGTQYEDLGPAILEAMDIADEGLEGTAGAMEEMQAITQQGLQPALQRLSRTLKVELFQALEPIITAFVLMLIPAIEDFAKFLMTDGVKAIKAFAKSAEDLGKKVLPTLTTIVETLFNFFNDNRDTILTFAEYLGKAAAVAGVVIGVIAGVSAAIAGFGTMLAIAGGALALITSPIGILIGLLVAFQYAYEQNFMGFGDAVNSAVDSAKQGFDRLVEFATGLLDAFKSGGFEGAGDFIKTNLIDPLVNGLAEYVNGGQLVEDAKALGASLLTGISAGLDLISNAGTWLNTNLITPLATAAGEYVSSGGLKDTMFALGKGLMDGIQLGIVLYGDLLNFIYNNIVAPLAESVSAYVSSGQLWDNIQALGKGLWEGLKAGLEAYGDAQQFVWENLIAPFADGVLASLEDGTLVGSLTSLGASILSSLATALIFAGDWVSVNLIDPLAGLISNVSIGGVTDAMASIGVGMMEALGGAISSAAGGIESAVKEAINSAIPDHIGFRVGQIKAGPVVLYDGGNIGIDIPNPFRMGTPWTGFGALDQVAGTVHRQEAVVPAHGMAVYPSPHGLQLAGAMGGMGGNGQPIILNITLELDGQVIYERMETIRQQRAPK